MSEYKKNSTKIKTELKEENKRKNLNENIQKINDIINRQFQIELDHRQSQLELIQQRLSEAQKSLHLLRYVLVTSYYNENDKASNKLDESLNEDSVINKSQIHPAVKKLLGKNVHNYKFDFVQGTRKRKKAETAVKQEKVEKQIKTEVSLASETALPAAEEVPFDTVRNRKKSKYRVVVGNISKSIISNSSEDKSTHKWMVYVRGSRESPDISHFVQKVVLYLHPSYRPNDVIEIKEAPFHLSRRGWGEFPLRVRIFFHCSLNKPIDIIHNLKLDSTFTGRQTLGNETVVNLFLYDLESNSCENQDLEAVKQEPDEQPSEHKRKLPAESFMEVKKIKLEPLVDAQETQEQLEHDYCFTKVKEEQTEENCDVKLKQIDEYSYLMEHSYSSISASSAPAASGSTLANQDSNLVYGLTDCDEPTNVIEEPVLEDLKVVTRNFVVDNGNRVISIKKHRKPQESLLKNSMQTKMVSVLQANSNGVDYKKYQINFPSHRFKSVMEALPYLFKRLPLISKFACDTNYKCTYPYVASSSEEYYMWNVGKRASSEWFRVKTIKRIISSSHLAPYNNFSTKDLMLYGRAYGYTPLANYKIFNKYQAPSACSINGESCIPKPLTADNSVEPDVDVDIVNIPSNPNRTKKSTNREKLIDHSCQMACSYVKEAVLDVGIVLKPEEIIEGVIFNSAERMLLQAGMTLAEDVIRKARSNLVCQGNFNEQTAVIGVEDIKKAIDSKPHYKTLMERYINERKYLT